MPKVPVKSGIVVTDEPLPPIQEETPEERQQTFPGIEPPPLSVLQFEQPQVNALEEPDAVPVGEKLEETAGEKTSGETVSGNEAENIQKKSETSKKRSFGEVMVMEHMSIPNPANRPGEKDHIEVYRLIEESAIEGQSPADAEKWLVSEAEDPNGVIDSGRFTIIRRVKDVQVKSEVIRKVSIEDIEE